MLSDSTVFALSQIAHFTDQRRRFVVENGNLRVGGLGAVGLAEAPANAHHPPRRAVLAQCPACNVDGVRTVVTDLAIARLPEPMPLVVQLRSHHWQSSS